MPKNCQNRGYLFDYEKKSETIYGVNEIRIENPFHTLICDVFVNGEYLENLIEGYRTLTVQGREALSSEITTETAGTKAGSVFVSRKYP